MERELTTQDEGKPVVDANGEQIGTLTAIEDGSARVTPDQGLLDEIKTQLGWGSPDEDAYPLPQGRITEVADDEIRLDIG